MTSYDDGEDIPTPGEDIPPEHHVVINAIRAVPDPATRRVLMMLFVLAVLHGRVGR